MGSSVHFPTTGSHGSQRTPFSNSLYIPFSRQIPALSSSSLFSSSSSSTQTLASHLSLSLSQISILLLFLLSIFNGFWRSHGDVAIAEAAEPLPPWAPSLPSCLHFSLFLSFFPHFDLIILWIFHWVILNWWIDC